MPDNPSTEIALIHLIRDEFGAIRERMTRLELQYHIQHHQIMTALETLINSVNANVSGQAILTTAVNAAIVRIGTVGPTEAQLMTIAGQIDSSTNSDTALTNALNAALDAPPVVTPPPAA